MGELHRSTVLDESVAGSGTVTAEVGASEQAVLVVFWTVTNATAAGDIGAAEVRAVDPDGNIMPTPLVPESISGAALTGSVASLVERYDVRGLTRVELTFTNGNAAARDAKVFVNHYWE